MTSSKSLIIFLDSGDTLIDEGTEIRNSAGDVVHSEMIPGAWAALLSLYECGYTIALVADGTVQSFDNIYAEQNLSHCFAARAVSEAVGADKPDQRMFDTAMQLLNLSEADKQRIIMVGNNLERDIAGANRFGICSVWLNWTPRYRKEIFHPDEIPDYIITEPSELISLAEFLNQQIQRKAQLQTIY